MSTKRSKFEGLFEAGDTQEEHPLQQGENVAPTHEERLRRRNQEKKKSRKEEGVLPRIKTNYEIREDYVRAFKRIAVDDGRKIYQVLEEAMGEYLQRRAVTER